MVRLEVWPHHMGEWHGQLRDISSGDRIGPEWIANQRGAVIGVAFKCLPQHIPVMDVSPPNL